MSEKDQKQRRPDGAMKKGSTANKRGRPKQSNRIPHPEVFRDLKYAVAEYKVTVTLNGVEYQVPLVQANYLTLGINGAQGDRESAARFIADLERSIEQELRYMRDGWAELSKGKPAYMDAHDPEVREQMRRVYQYALDAVSGRRERVVGRFPPRRRPKRS